LSELDDTYREALAAAQEKIIPGDATDLVIGIPFLNGSKNVPYFLSILETGIDTFYPSLNARIICVTYSSSFSTMEAIDKYKPARQDRIKTVSLDQKLWGKGWSVRVLLDLSHHLTADLIILEPELLKAGDNSTLEGITPDWIKLLYHPVQEGHAQYVLPRFTKSYLSNSIEDHFVYPLVASLYNLEFKGCLGTGMAISNSLLAELLRDTSFWPEEAYDYGMEYWLLLLALELNSSFAEVQLGTKPKTAMPVSLNYMFTRTVHVVFQAIDKGKKVWIDNPQGLCSILNLGHRNDLFLQERPPESRPFIVNFRRGFNRFHEAIWSRIFPEELTARLEEAYASPEEEFSFPDTLWSQLLYEAIAAYHFIPELEKEDLAESLFPLFQGRIAGFLTEIKRAGHCELSRSSFQPPVCPFNARNNLEKQVDAFVSRRQLFLENWLHHKEALQPFLPEIAYWEFIPGIPILLPHLLQSASGKSVHVAPVYEQLLKEYKEEFDTFVRGTLDLTPEDGINKLGRGVRSLVKKVEQYLEEILLPGDIHSEAGTRDIAERIYRLYPYPKSLSLKKEVAAKLLQEHPPRNLITFWGYRDTEELLNNHHPLDVLALASWFEDTRYATWNSEWLRKNLRPDHFEMSPIRPLVVNYLDFPTVTGMKEAPSLNHLTNRVVISNMRPGSGGSFPKIRFLTTFLKNIIEAEQFGKAWESFWKAPNNEFSDKVINSLEGHWGVSMFSAHAIFENMQHRLLQKKLLEIARQEHNSSAGNPEPGKQILEQMAQVYHLGLTLPDGYFLTCSLWSWASYSFKGGKETPTPLSLMVEKRWFNSELFSRCYRQIEGPEEEIITRINELMGREEEHTNLVAWLWDAPTDSKNVVIPQKMEKDLPPAGKLKRSVYNPILTPTTSNAWESKYVLNCGAIRVNGDVYIFYRAVGEDGISRIGLAISKSGLEIDERFPEPVFSPGDKSESMGVEDPRLVEIEGRIYMLYTAYDGITPQIALASLSKEDLIQHRWKHWHRHGLVFPGFHNKDAVLFPERFDGKLVMYHRITPSIWVAFSDTFDTPWPREGHKILMGTRSGMMWDAIKIGAGAQPIKTLYGWLHIYHGVDYGFRYRLGVFLTSLDDPTKVVYRSPNPVLEPETSYELGVAGHSWVPNVVFTCGAVPKENKTILDKNDEILVYYGGADTVIGVATAKLGELIPESFLEENSNL